MVLAIGCVLMVVGAVISEVQERRRFRKNAEIGESFARRIGLRDNLRRDYGGGQ